MRPARVRSLPLAAALAAALGGCAGAQRPSPRAPAADCGPAFDHADRVLRDGLAAYVERMKAYAASRDPGATTAGAEARTRERADAWTAEHRPRFAAQCEGWPEEQRRCVRAADSPQALSACGLDELVTSFTDDVVATFAARPIEVAPAP